MRVAGLVLAAGGGSRFGGPKALVQFSGSSLVQRAMQTATEGGCDVVVAVVGAHAIPVLRAARGNADCIVINPHWQEGLSSSLHAGLAALPATDVQAALVMLVDQPLVTPALVTRLISAWRSGAPAVAATYGGVRRTPVVLDRSVWAELLAAAHGDRGARGWLRSHPDQVAAVACDDVGAPDDIDTPADLQRLVMAAAARD